MGTTSNEHIEEYIPKKGTNKMTTKIAYRSECKHRYINHRTLETTARATTAMEWYRNGDTVQIDTLNPSGSLRDSNSVTPRSIPEKRDENREHCKSISDDLDKYVDGIVHHCPDCGSTIEIPETVGDKFKCPCCGEVHDIEDFEQLSLYDYFDGDVLDIDFTVNYQKEYKAVRICVAWGGPSIYIDTLSGNVELYWWTERASYRMRSDVIDALDEWAEEYFNCI